MAAQDNIGDFLRQALVRNLRWLKESQGLDYLAAVSLRWLSMAAVLWYAFVCGVVTCDYLAAYTFDPSVDDIRFLFTEPPGLLEFLASILPYFLHIQFSLALFLAAGWYLGWKFTASDKQSTEKPS